MTRRPGDPAAAAGSPASFLPSAATICVVSANRAGAVSVLRVLCGNKEGAA